MLFHKRLPSWLRIAYHYDSLAAIFYGVFFGLVIHFFSFVARTIGANDVQIAILNAAPFIGAIFAFYWAHHSSQKRKMPFLVKLKGIARVFVLLMLLPVNVWLFVIVVCLYWFFEMAASPAYMGIMKDIYPTEYRGRAMGYVRVEMALTIALATFAGGHLLNIRPDSYRWVFALGAVFCLLSLVFFRKIKVESDSRVKANRQRFSLFKVITILREDKRFLHYQLILFFAGFGWLISMTLYPIAVVDYLNLSNASFGKIGSIFSIFWVISFLISGEYIDKKGPLTIRSLVILLLSLVSLLYLLAIRFPNAGFWLIAVAAVFKGLAWGGGELSRINYLTRIASEDKIQSYWGVESILMGIRGISAPFVAIGLKRQFGMQSAFLIVFFMLFVSFILVVLFSKRHAADDSITPADLKPGSIPSP